MQHVNWDKSDFFLEKRFETSGCPQGKKSKKLKDSENVWRPHPCSCVWIQSWLNVTFSFNIRSIQHVWSLWLLTWNMILYCSSGRFTTHMLQPMVTPDARPLISVSSSYLSVLRPLQVPQKTTVSIIQLWPLTSGSDVLGWVFALSLSRLFVLFISLWPLTQNEVQRDNFLFNSPRLKRRSTDCFYSKSTRFQTNSLKNCNPCCQRSFVKSCACSFIKKVQWDVNVFCWYLCSFRGSSAKRQIFIKVNFQSFFWWFWHKRTKVWNCSFSFP